MTSVRLDFTPLSLGDLADLERLLVLIRGKFPVGDPAHAATRLLLLAIDTHRAQGHRRRGAATVRIFTGQDDPEIEAFARRSLALMLQAARDQDWLSDPLRTFLNDVMFELVDADKTAAAEADAIRTLYIAKSSRNPQEAA